MSLLEILQFVGYGTGAVLTIWMAALLLKWRRGLGGVERILFALAVSIGVWHSTNLILVLNRLLGFEQTRWANILRLTDSLAVISIVLAYSFLLHLHLHLWSNARSRSLTFTERVRVYMSYIPAIFLIRAIQYLWSSDYEPMLDKLARVQFLALLNVNFVQAFMLWAVYVLIFISITDLAIAHVSTDHSEKRFMQALSGSFLLIASLIFVVYVAGIGRGTMLAPYLATLANLGSLLPTGLLAQRIYRQRYLDLVIRESLVVATFAVVILIVYLFGIRAIGVWSGLKYGVRSEVVESILILMLALGARPLRKWLEKRFQRIFEKEAKLYREVVARIGSHKEKFQTLSRLLRFIEERTAKDLALRRVCLISLNVETGGLVLSEPSNSEPAISLVNEIFAEFQNNERRPLADTAQLKALDYVIAYPLVYKDRVLGLMLVDAPADALTQDLRGVLEVVGGQVALAIEDYRLIEENVRLELRLAQDARLAALGQMAATVAHEVKNPLSAIKSIAQVLREDVNLENYERDLTLIVGETDRLNNSLTQLLSFARSSPEMISPACVDELVRELMDLFQAQAVRSGVELNFNIENNVEVNGSIASAIRDALSNLLLNALQATPAGGRVTINAAPLGHELLITVTDTGMGIVPELEERIWEPFFTTRQRGTGLGLAIVRKRIEDVGGTTKLSRMNANKGSRFELHLPLDPKR